MFRRWRHPWTRARSLVNVWMIVALLGAPGAGAHELLRDGARRAAPSLGWAATTLVAALAAASGAVTPAGAETSEGSPGAAALPAPTSTATGALRLPVAAAEASPSAEKGATTSGGFGIAAVAYQTISSTGPLTRIYIGNELSCQVAHVSDSVLEFYPPGTIPGDCGTFLVAGGVLYAPDFANHGGTATGNLGPYTPFTPVSQSAVTGSGTSADPYTVVTVVDAGSTGLRLTQTDTYVVGETSYRTDVQVTNTSGASQSVLVYRVGDCYLANSDFGYGAADGALKAVACSATPNNTPSGRFEQWKPVTGGNTYYEAFYAQVWSAIGAKAPFNDTCRCTEHIDNGAGLSRSVSVPSGARRPCLSSPGSPTCWRSSRRRRVYSTTYRSSTGRPPPTRYTRSRAATCTRSRTSPSRGGGRVRCSPAR